MDQWIIHHFTNNLWLKLYYNNLFVDHHIFGGIVLKVKILLIMIFFVAATFLGTSAAANVTNLTSTSIDHNITITNSTNITDILNASNVTSDNLTKKINSTISGNVTRCDNGKPFQGVTITVKTLTGGLVGTTTTNVNGSYNFIFSGDEKNYDITASYPGHVPSTKDVTMIKDVTSGQNQTITYHGFANFTLGPMPGLTITAPSTQLLNQSFSFNLYFNNTGNVTGFGPMVQLILPSQIQLTSANFLGAPVTVSSAQTFPISGILTDPLTGLNVTGTPGYTFYTLIYPLGSFTMGQPTAVITVNALLLGNSTLGVPLNITGYPVFRFGANATGTIPLRGNVATAPVTPTVITINKTDNAHEQETATGKNYPVTYTLTVDVANGRTVNNVVLTDTIPNNLQFIAVTNADGGTVTSTPSTTSPGGILSINFGNLTGVIGTIRTVTYDVYAPLNDSSSNPVINPTTGLPVNATNIANVTGTYNGTNVSSSTNSTLELKSLAVQKVVSDITDPSASRPNDILHYTVNFQVSDYFSLKQLVINDNLGDGQTFLSNAAHNPTLSVNLPNVGIVNLNFNITDPTEFQMAYNATTGITSLVFNVSQILINNNYTGVLAGGNYTGNNYGATQGSINFWSQIDVNYNSPNRPVVSGDYIDNNVTGNAQLVNSNNTVSDGSSTQVVIVMPTASKTIVNVERNGVNLGPINDIQPGDDVTFALTVDVPTSNLQQFYMVDYLPIPIFNSSQFSTDQSPSTQGSDPAPGEWCLASDDTLSVLSGVVPTLTVDPVQNTLTFNYGDVYNSTQPMSVAHILFTVTATGEPMDDGLYLTNLLNVNYNNSFSQMFTNNQIVSIVTAEPDLTINKTADPNTGRQAGDTVTYTITITNTGHAPSYNVNVTDNLLNNYSSYIQGTPTVTANYENGSSIDLTGLGNLFGTGLNFGALYPIYGINETNNTIIITYNATLSSNVTPLQVINNTAEITNFTSLPQSNSTNFVTDPNNYQANATVTMLGPQFTKTYIGSKGGPSSGSNLTIGEVGRFSLATTLPAGQINDLVITDQLPAGMVYEDYTLVNNPLITLSPIDFYQTSNATGNFLTFSFPGLTNTTYGTNETFYILLDLMVADNNTSNPPHTTPAKVNTASMDWNDTGHNPITSSSSVNIIEPQLQVTKSFTPNIGAGGQIVVVNLQIKNIGNSTAYNVLITDPLAASGSIFDLNSVQSYNQNGFVYSYTSNTVTFTGGNITPGQTLNFTFNATVLTNVTIGPNFNNTAYANYYSLLNGTNPDPNARNYTDSGSAIFHSGDPIISKVVESSTIHGNSGNLAIGEYVTYRITATFPEGQADNLTISDILPVGFDYVNSTLNSPLWNGTLGNYIVSTSGSTLTGLNVTFLFSGTSTSLMNNNTFFIDLEAVVLNATGNVVGNTKTNNVNLTWAENTHGPFTASVNTTLVGPKITITKTVTPNPVDGGDTMNVSLKVSNTGNSPAYEVSLTDVLNTTLFDLTSLNFSPPTGYTYSLTNNTLNIIAAPGTFINNTGNSTLYFNFTINATSNVPSNSTFTNMANATYYSMPSSFPDTRSSTVNSNIVSIKTVAPSVTKTLVSTSEPYTNGTKNVMIGEVAEYSLNLTIPQGTTNNVILTDILPSNLQYNTGTAMIMRSTGNITATGFTFTQVGTYEDYTGSINPQLTFNLGNITFPGTNGLNNATISIIFNATVLNTNINQEGAVIPNNVTFNFTNASGTNQKLTGVGPNLTVITPQLSTTKIANPTSVEGGQTVNFTIQVNNNVTNGAPSYDVQITDPLIGYNNLDILSIVPSNSTMSYYNNSTSNLLNITISELDPNQYLNVTYQANLNNNVTYGQQVNNTVTATGTSLPGDYGTNNATPGAPGTTNGKRTGDSSQPAGNVNNIIANSTAVTTVRSPTISKNVNGQKNMNLTIGGTTNENIIASLPEGTTNDLEVVDQLPVGLQFGDFSYTTTTGILVNQFNVSSIGNTYTFDFGNITALQEGNITVTYTVVVRNISGNTNGQNLTNNATLYYLNITGQTVNAGSDNANIQVIEPNLQITKTSSTTDLNIGDTFTYTLFINHSSSSTADADNIIITDSLPASLTYVSGSAVLPSNWVMSVTGKTMTFSTSVLTLAENNATITFECTVNNDITLAGKNLTNTVNMNYTSLPSGGRDYGPVSSSNTVHVLGADLLVIKTGTLNVSAGQGVSYTVTVTNLGPDTADNVIFTDTFTPSWFNELINPKYSLNGGTFNNITVDPWTIFLGNISSGNTSTILITGTISPSAQPGTLNNTASATSNTTDPNPNNNNSTVLTTVNTVAGLSVVKTGAASVVAGDNLVYTVVVSNGGPSDAQDVELNDVVPVAGTTWYLNGVYMGDWTGSAYLGVLASGADDTLVFNCTVPSSTVDGTVLNNTAFVSSPTDPLTHNSTVLTTVDTVAGLSVVKTGAASVVAGDNLVYTVVVSNGGPSDAQDVELNDVVPVAGATWYLNGDYMGDWTGSYDLGVMESGTNDTLVFNCTVPSSTVDGTVLNNTAFVSSPTDPLTHNSTVLTTVDTVAGLSVVKTGAASVVAGDNLVYTVVVSNGGPSDAQDVELNDVVPVAGTTWYLNGDYMGDWTGSAYLGVLASGANDTLVFNCTVPSSTVDGTVLNNTAFVSSPTDPLTHNSTVLTTVDTVAGLSVVKTGAASVVAGDNLVYTVVVSNGGPSDAQDVELNDVVPVAGATWYLNGDYMGDWTGSYI